MKKSVILLAMLLVLTVSWAARAEAPPFMPIQGVLTDNAGDPVDGETDMVFTLYDAAGEGTALWTETQTIMVEDGFFTAYLGDIEDLDLVLFLDNDELWLGIAVEDDDEMPLVYIGSVAYAGYAEYCGNIPDHDHAFDDLTGSMPAEMLPDNAVVGAQACEDTDKVTGVDAEGALLCGEDLDLDTHINSQACGDTDKVTGVDADGLLICDTDINTDTTYDGTDFALSDQSPCSGTDKVVGVNASGGLICSADVSADSDWTVAGSDMYSAVSGNVGIGISSPNEKLDVDGNVEVTGDYDYASAKTGYYWVGRDDLAFNDYNEDDYSQRLYATWNPLLIDGASAPYDGTFHGEVHLPNGVTVTEMICHFYDNRNPGYVRATLFRADIRGTKAGDLAEVVTTDAETPNHVARTDSDITNAVINLNTYQYMLEVFMTCPVTDQMAFYACKITYETQRVTY